MTLYSLIPQLQINVALFVLIISPPPNGRPGRREWVGIVANRCKETAVAKKHPLETKKLVFQGVY